MAPTAPGCGVWVSLCFPAGQPVGCGRERLLPLRWLWACRDCLSRSWCGRCSGCHGGAWSLSLGDGVVGRQRGAYGGGAGACVCVLEDVCRGAKAGRLSPVWVVAPSPARAITFFFLPYEQALSVGGMPLLDGCGREPTEGQFAGCVHRPALTFVWKLCHQVMRTPCVATPPPSTRTKKGTRQYQGVHTGSADCLI